MESQLRKHGATPLGTTPEEFHKFLISEIAKYTEVARTAKIRIE
jgi:tripartite-type tricarboxylate transporter receptor subunit TctC